LCIGCPIIQIAGVILTEKAEVSLATVGRIVFLGVRLVSDNRRIFPRRYHCSDGHHHTIIGLTGDETSEFERLDQQLPLDHSGNVSWDFERGPKTEVEKRWLELYRKHETAWNEWLDPIKVAAAD
jgi:hypothetical protein